MTKVFYYLHLGLAIYIALVVGIMPALPFALGAYLLNKNKIEGFTALAIGMALLNMALLSGVDVAVWLASLFVYIENK